MKHHQYLIARSSGLLTARQIRKERGKRLLRKQLRKGTAK